jgi:hypothetical protein
MGGDEFWSNLRTAARVLAQNGSTDWLTPGFLDDFDPQDFAFLEPSDRDQLMRNAETLRRIVSQLPGDRPASEQQLQEAETAVREMIRLLRVQEFLNLEAFKIQYRLERALVGKLPHWIENFVCETGTDVGDDPALWVILNVSQEAVDNDLVVKQGQQVRAVVEAAVRRLRIDRWPYVRFQSLDELAASRKGRRK